MLTTRPSAVSLFAGAGGFDIGLEQAGFETVLAIDNDPDAIRTLSDSKAAGLELSDGRTYLEAARIEEADLTRVTKARLLELYGRPAGSLDILAGGPPCQSFSSAGRMKSLHDERGRLFEEFVRAARALRPRLILFENVQGLVTARDWEGRVGGVLELVEQAFDGAGYAMSWALVNAADYGAAQRRVRLVGLGSRRHALPQMPPPATHSKSEDQESLLEPWVTLRQSLADFPPPADEDIVRPKPDLAMQLELVRPGSGIRVGGTVEANRPGGHWGYRQDGFVADWDQAARTVRAASTPDWVRLEDGSHRRLTYLECAHLQGFPPDWRFVGTLASCFRQIGNAVPVQLAAALGVHAREVLNRDELPRGRRPESPAWPKAFRRRIRYTTSEERVNGAARKTRALELV